ncbi:serine O-acetyltransferase EpsC [Pseudoramibacter sp.]|jgi:serine O-acetyltransferase|uniref:serine O-acetyltransferase EpsC n=1 Tax=Pseudoramibacter sp. TaxID=2034862 RepID=UPI0025E26BFA|nr:serine O-acetyltransferase EpsC [Pseudoramibacter sp.]MCH4071574.1 serine acetyltransferase [Pseudoramibacter sp.]MCH4105342.1 serine acetyltransferase [Pseudoramibacter sp.]
MKTIKNAEMEDEINHITNMLMLDYSENKKIDQLLPYQHPDREIVMALIRHLMILIYPGYYRNKVYHAYTRRTNVQMILEDVVHNLIQQIKMTLPYLPEYQNAGHSALTKKAKELTFTYLKQLPEIRAYTETDVQAAYEGDPAAFNKDEIIFSYPGLYATLVNRLAHGLYKLNVPILPRMMTELAHGITGIDIHPGATIGKYFFIDHGTGIVIGETTVIGDHVKIYQGVTLGALSTKGGQSLKNVKRHPTIEDNVTVYSGASILGGDTVIGEGSVIGGSCFITTSIPPHARVSIKNQELSIDYAKKKNGQSSEPKEIPMDDRWFYMI